MEKIDCFLCEPLIDRGGYIQITPNLRLCADIAPLVEGHFLLYASRHCINFANFPNTLLAELQTTISIILNKFFNKSNNYLLLEHGPHHSKTNIVGCCDHAHIHIIPIPMNDINIEYNKNKFKDNILSYVNDGSLSYVMTCRVDCLNKIQARDYLWYSFDGINTHVYKLNVASRQFLRKITADMLGLNAFASWDFYDEDSAQRTTKKIADTMRSTDYTSCTDYS